MMVDRHWDGILAFCDKKVSLGYIESANLKARNVIRRAYGYHDKEYMKLKFSPMDRLLEAGSLVN